MSEIIELACPRCGLANHKHIGDPFNKDEEIRCGIGADDERCGELLAKVEYRDVAGAPDVIERITVHGKIIRTSIENAQIQKA